MYEEVRSLITLKQAIKSDPASAFQLHYIFLFGEFTVSFIFVTFLKDVFLTCTEISCWYTYQYKIFVLAINSNKNKCALVFPFFHGTVFGLLLGPPMVSITTIWIQ